MAITWWKVSDFTNPDWRGSSSDKSSTTRCCTFLGGESLLTQKCKKQNVVAKSSAEAEYRLMAHTCQLAYLVSLQESGFTVSTPIPIFCEHRAAIHIASNLVFHEKTKHIEVDWHFVRIKILNGAIATLLISPFVFLIT